MQIITTHPHDTDNDDDLDMKDDDDILMLLKLMMMIDNVPRNLIVSHIPLPAFHRASTIHKSQGCTLDCAELMLDNTFDHGQGS